MNCEELLEPIWKTNRITDEFLAFEEDLNGKKSATLLFEPTNIMYVKNAELTETYQEGIDYIVSGREIILTENSRIFFFTQNDLFGDGMPKVNHFKRDDGRPSLHSEGTFFHKRQIAVTYECKNTWDGYYPTYACNKLPHTEKVLKEGGKLSVTLFGDSISFGCNASGLGSDGEKASPYLPNWFDLVGIDLKSNYPNVEFAFHNPSVIGMDSLWGVENIDELVLKDNPDLVIIAFGMNDRCTPEVFQGYIAEMMKKGKFKNPNMEFILVATTVPNPVLSHPDCPFVAYQWEYKDALYQLCSDGVIVANMTDLHKYLLTKKSFLSLTGNFVNHPNDFLIRVHAQCILALLKKD